MPFSNAEKKKVYRDQTRALKEAGYVLIDGRLVCLEER